MFSVFSVHFSAVPLAAYVKAGSVNRTGVKLNDKNSDNALRVRKSELLSIISYLFNRLQKK
ncbi:MAG: hypothetical protein IJI67_07205, partial [Clostridia bacterium]|nr:hypothetical protein [Clostridia bacterium]